MATKIDFPLIWKVDNCNKHMCLAGLLVVPFFDKELFVPSVCTSCMFPKFPLHNLFCWHPSPFLMKIDVFRQKRTAVWDSGNLETEIAFLVIFSLVFWLNFPHGSLNMHSHV